MPPLHRPHGTIRTCHQRSIASSLGAWQKTPRTASRTATNSLLHFIRLRVHVLHPRRPKSRSPSGCRGLADSATFGSPRPSVCCLLDLFRSLVPSALVSSFPLPLQFIFPCRGRPPKPSPTRHKRRRKLRKQAPQVTSFD